MHASKARSSSRAGSRGSTRLSDGRLVVGVGQGWMEQEFQAAGVSTKRRGAGLEEHILLGDLRLGHDP